MKADKDHIRSIISMQDVMGLYNLRPHHRNVYPCPFHAEKTPSLYAYDGDRGFYCFGCGAGGSIFDFVQRMNDCDFPAALDFICDNFGIPNDNETTPQQRREFARSLQERQKAAQERQQRIEAGKYAYRRLCEYRLFLAEQKGCSPERCHMMEYVEYLLGVYLADMEGMGRDFTDVDGWMKEVRGRLAVAGLVGK